MPSASVFAPEAWSLSFYGRSRPEGFVRALYASACVLGVAVLLALLAERHAVDIVRWSGAALAAGLTMASLWHAAAASVRRLRDAGMTPALALLVVVPGVNVLFLAFLAWRPSVGDAQGEAVREKREETEPLTGPVGTPVRLGTVVPSAAPSMPSATSGLADPVERLWTEFLLAAEGESPSVQVQLRVRYRAKLEKLAKEGKCAPEATARMGRRIMTEPLEPRG